MLIATSIPDMRTDTCNRSVEDRHARNFKSGDGTIADGAGDSSTPTCWLRTKNHRTPRYLQKPSRCMGRVTWLNETSRRVALKKFLLSGI